MHESLILSYIRWFRWTGFIHSQSKRGQNINRRKNCFSALNIDLFPNSSLTIISPRFSQSYLAATIYRAPITTVQYNSTQYKAELWWMTSFSQLQHNCYLAQQLGLVTEGRQLQSSKVATKWICFYSFFHICRNIIKLNKCLAHGPKSADLKLCRHLLCLHLDRRKLAQN